MDSISMIRRIRGIALAFAAAMSLTVLPSCIETQIKTKDRASETAVLVACQALMTNLRMAAIDKGRAPTLQETQSVAMPELRSSIIGADGARPASGYQGYCFVYLTADDGALPAYAVLACPLANLPGSADRPSFYISSGVGRVFKASASVALPSTPFPDEIGRAHV